MKHFVGLLIVLVLLIVTERVKPSDEGCPEDCGDECKPICAEHEDKKVQLTFCSHCVMEMYNCHNDDSTFHTFRM
ncbi:hypothetical protein C0J52_08207 [Blattella germanica]|nr:hypothetical protein C0J52_08207 [Blattella germanica]